MLIIYRTNAGFEGQIQDVQENGYGPIFDALVQQQQPGAPPLDLAYIELDVTTVPAAALTDLWVNRSHYTVDPSGPSLLLDGNVVYTAPAPAVKPVIGPPNNITPVKPTSVSWAGAGPVAWVR